MKVKTYGISIAPECGKVSMQNLVDLMKNQSGASDNTKSNERRFYIASVDEDFIAGLVVTIKDQKRFCKLHGDGAAFTISVENIQGQQKLMEFNFFVLNIKNGLGLYQHYHQSCSPGTFFDYLKRRYISLRNASRDNEIEALKTGGTHTGKTEKQVRKAHSGGLSTAYLLRKDSLQEVLSKYKSIKNFHYEYAELAPEHTAGEPISPWVKRKRQVVTFVRNANVGALAAAIQQMATALRGGHVGVVEETDDDEVPLSVKIADIPDNFGESDYDALTQSLDNLDVTLFSQHQVIKDMHDACVNSHKHIFLQAVK